MAFKARALGGGVGHLGALVAGHDLLEGLEEHALKVEARHLVLGQELEGELPQGIHGIPCRRDRKQDG